MAFVSTYFFFIWSCIIFISSSQGQNVQKFSVELFKAVAQSRPTENIALSPFSADAALSMVFTGAMKTTKTELGSVLGIAPDQGANLREKFQSVNAASPSYTLQSANGLFLEKTYAILPRFRFTVQSDFAANVTSVDFANNAEEARTKINTFVASNTNNKITNLFAPKSLTAQTKLVLVNAVYFKADWERRFKKYQTSHDASWTHASGRVKTPIDLMNINAEFPYAESAELGGAQVLELKYKKGETSMVVILPKKETGIQGLESSLTAEKLDTTLQQLSSGNAAYVQVYLPKFKTTARYDLVDPLKALGVKAAFTEAADFSGISNKRNLAISKVVQKVFVAIDEDGTEAAAATGIEMMPLSADFTPPNSKVFRADRPFLYLIRHNQSKAILFMGRVSDPTQ